VTGGRPSLRSTSFKKGADHANPGQDESKIGWTSAFSIDVHYIDYDGTWISPELPRISFQIRRYSGKRPITELDLYPAAFAPDFEEKKQMLIDRGELFAQYLDKFQRKTYQGMTMRSTERSEPEDVDGEVIIDVKACYDLAAPDEKKNLPGTLDPTDSDRYECFEVAECGVSGCTECTSIYDDSAFDRRRYDEYKDSKSPSLLESGPDAITDEHRLLFPRDIPAFILRSRSWSEW
jgi:hypothetical protein